MEWCHPTTKRLLESIPAKPGSYIFVGPDLDALAATTQLSQRLNCAGAGQDGCAVCLNISRGSFPDLIQVRSEGALGIDQIHELGSTLSRRPLDAQIVRIATIQASQGLSAEAQNRLLKLLEEPPSQTILVISASDLSLLLPTIRSRCQIITFLPPSRNQLHQQLQQNLSPTDFATISKLHPKTWAQAKAWLVDPEARAMRLEDLAWAQRFLASNPFNRMVMSGACKTATTARRLIETMAELVRHPDPHQLSKLEHAARWVAANVSPRNALEGLALEL